MILERKEARTMKVRPAKRDDLGDIMTCVRRLKKEYFEEKGIPQWQGDYPSRETFLSDIEGGRLFVMYMGECLVGFTSVCFEPDPCYTEIEGEGWKNDGAYAVVHRFGINPDWHGMGMGKALMGLADRFCEAKKVSAIRADTHEANAAMIGLLKKCGFEERGTIHLADGAPRLAFEKNL